jgi:hypothetical protein
MWPLRAPKRPNSGSIRQLHRDLPPTYGLPSSIFSPVSPLRVYALTFSVHAFHSGIKIVMGPR